MLTFANASLMAEFAAEPTPCVPNPYGMDLRVSSDGTQLEACTKARRASEHAVFLPGDVTPTVLRP